MPSPLPVSMGSPIPSWDGAARHGRGLSLSPPLSNPTQPCSSGGTRAGGSLLLSDTSKGGRLHLQLPQLSQKSNFSPLNIPHTSANTPTSEQGRRKAAASHLSQQSLASMATPFPCCCTAPGHPPHHAFATEANLIFENAQGKPSPALHPKYRGVIPP